MSEEAEKKQQRNVAFSKHRDKDNDGIDNDKDNETADIMVKEIMKKIMTVSIMIINNTADIMRSLSEETGKISGAPRARRQKKSNREIWPFQNMMIKIMKRTMIVFLMIKIMTPNITRSLYK